MVERPRAPYRSANSGELSEEAAGRVDIKQFYAAGLKFKNFEPVPLSGFRRMAGSFDLGPVRRRVAEMSLANVAATPGPHGVGAFTIWQADAVGVVAAIDVAALSASAGAPLIRAEAFAAGQWVRLGAEATTAIEAGLAAQALSFAAAPGLGLNATQVRLVAVTAVGATISLGAVKVHEEGEIIDRPRYASVTHDSGSRYFFSLQAGFLDIYEDDQFVAGIALPEVTPAILPEVNFYAENATIGLFARDLETPRVRRDGASAKWIRDKWPYDGLPKVDLGGVYAKTDDVWVVNVKWTGNPFIRLQLTVNGETTPSIPYVDALNVPVVVGGADLTATAAMIKAELESLPSLGPTVSVAITLPGGASHDITITFGGALSGDEYQVSSIVPNTADAAALAAHIEIGKTEFEPLISAARGWPGSTALIQDRLAYGDFKAVPPALGWSAVAEYFNLNIEASGDGAARLDKLRGGQISERVLHVLETIYPLIFTSRAVYFAANRVIKKGEPLNFAVTSQDGAVPNCDPALLESSVYYIGVNPKSIPPSGHQVLSLAYNEIETRFDAVPQHIFASHLVQGVARLKGQRSNDKADASRLWMLREDGRVVAASVIQSQEVLGFYEWVLAHQGAAREIHVDAGNDVRIAVERSGGMRHERLDRATTLQATIARKADLAGQVRGLGLHEGREVWAKAEGYYLGPFTVVAGAINLGDAYVGDIQVGLFQPPLFESMPRYLITRNDEIVKRPGRIHGVQCEAIASESLAIGANGGKPENVPLSEIGDPEDEATPAKSGKFGREGILGMAAGTTYVVTQLRPGELHVRDIVIGERL